MKSIVIFLRTTIAGGILFLLPLFILVTIAKKGLNILQWIISPFADQFKTEIIWGLTGHNLAAIVILLILCFISGLLFRLSVIQNTVSKVEKNLLVYLPGYLLLKSLAAESLSKPNEDTMNPVLIHFEDSYRPGFLVEQLGDFCTVFIPEPPNIRAGELHIIPEKSVIRLPISGNKMRKIIASFGKGASAMIPLHENENLHRL